MNPTAGNLEPQLRLFLSVDVQDSTAFKQQADENDPAPWREYFLTFFRDFPGEFERRLRLPPDAPAPAPWKFLGDEIVFVQRIHRLDEIVPLLASFRDAVAGYRPKVEKLRRLRLKAFAWVAGFPVGNAIVQMERGDGRKEDDFVGPSMDTGFRLSQIATWRRMALSVELAWMVLSLPERKRRALALHYAGRCPLKGVMQRDGYPFVWTDIHAGQPPALVAAEDRLTPNRPAKAADLRRFCERYIREHGEPRFVPFIPGSFDRRSRNERALFTKQLDRIKSDEQRVWGDLQPIEQIHRPSQRPRGGRKERRTIEQLLQSLKTIQRR